jgi:gliding motility-associated lipoprotein GldH
MYKKFVFCSFLFMLILTGCKKSDEVVSYHKFKDRTWNRFDIIRFDLPVTDVKKPFDVIFFANHTKEYEFDNLEFNMVMTTPSGEERIKEYKFLIKNKTGGFTGDCSRDSCTSSIVLKRGLRMDKKGVLRIEIETLIPRVQINALLGIGIRLVRTGQ